MVAFNKIILTGKYCLKSGVSLLCFPILVPDISNRRSFIVSKCINDQNNFEISRYKQFFGVYVAKQNEY